MYISTQTPHPVDLEVEAARVADWFPLGVPPPQRGGVGLAVGADHPRPAVPGSRPETKFVIFISFSIKTTFNFFLRIFQAVP